MAPVAPGLAPPFPRASFVLEPPRVRIGDLAALELVVVTPPDHRVRPIEPPLAVQGFWLLGVEPLPVERAETRWIHRMRLHIRARELGVFLWPAQKVEIDGPDGARALLEVPAHTIEVTSVLPEHAQRSTPYGLRAPPTFPSDRNPLAPAAIGGLLTLFCVGLIALVRRERRLRRSTGNTASEPEEPSAWEETLSALAAAAAESDVRCSADSAALALRRYAAHHFRAPTHSATTPELRAAPAPYLMHARWPAFLGLLEALDEARFRPDAPMREASVRSQVQAAAAFVRDSVPTARLR
ncbi:MAG TPA: hypothetical protein VKM54_14325 [Myxococcota bacterium]|nr:hypothetical protein [Myxococcota bacterium]